MKKVKKKDFKKWVKKHKIPLIIAGIVILLLITTGIGAKILLFVNFMLGNDTVIKLRSSDEVVYLQKGEETNIDFSASVAANPFCSAECSYVFEDISKGNEIDKSEFSIRPGDSISKEYSLKAEKAGSGIELYRFSMNCQSKNSVLCHTSEIPTTRSALVIMNYDLSEEDKESKEKAEKIIDLLPLIEILNSRQVDLEVFSDDIINTTDAESLKADVAQLKSKVYSVTELAKGIERAWNLHDYKQAADKADQAAEEFDDAWESFVDVNNSANVFAERYNYAIELLNDADDMMLKLKEMTILDQAIADQINAAAVELSNTFNLFFESNTLDEKEDAANIAFESVNKAYIAAIENIKNKPNALLSNLSDAYNQLCADTSDCFNYSMNSTNISFACSEIDDFYSILDGLNVTNGSYIDKCVALNLTYFAMPELAEVSVNYSLPVSLGLDFSEPLPECCVFGECEACCIGECRNNAENYPIIYVHGHAIDQSASAEYSLEGFNKINDQLEEDGYLNAGAITLYSDPDFPEGNLGMPDVPMSFRVSYYFDLFKEPENYIAVQAKSENIDTYAIRLRELIDIVKYRTGRPKVNIIAFSMGGLVSRRYMQIFGEDDVNKLIMIGTPNHGTSGRIKEICPLTGAELECRDMNSDSLFINKLNREKLPEIPVYNIIGTGCDMDGKQGDGAVLEESAYLEGAENIVINGECRSLTYPLHLDLGNIEMYPEVYETIKNALS